MDNKNRIKVSFFMIFIIAVAVFISSNRFEEETMVCGTPDFISICGNTLDENQKEGRKLFKILCASCHKLDKKLIGPALGGIKRDSISFFNYIVIKDTITNNYHKPNFKQLSIQNTNEILLYLNN
ncbi:c-type cytochrome [Polaribacter aestuariivivens]|uniref:c-type cytochrome n=1 Tax=Polaribacter aestuariivivens TaxID=2304626 RepID=UPI001486453F|nr:cytochrome c [Polaribacter aestuariivivens]